MIKLFVVAALIALGVAMIRHMVLFEYFAGWGDQCNNPDCDDPNCRSQLMMTAPPEMAGGVVLAIAALLLLAGCATTSSRDRALIAAGQAAATLPAMAAIELACTDEPHAPAPKGAARVRESQVTNYILDLREAGADCRDKLGVARRVFRKVEEVRSRAVPPASKGETK